MAKEVDEVGDRVLEETRRFCVQTLSEAFLNTSLRSACLSDEAFIVVESKTCGLGTTVHDLQSIGCWIEGILLYFMFC